ncbi:unnamed protein product [Closterium sp. NIES-54]
MYSTLYLSRPHECRVGKMWKVGYIELGKPPYIPLAPTGYSFNGQKTAGVKESYPWAYQQWLDSLLRLPAVRQRRFLAFRHATSPITNALGALVFLGTPFYIKKWQSNGLLWFALSLLFSVALMYVFIIAYTSFIQFIVLLIAGRLQDFYTQSGPHFLIATSVMLLVLIKQIMDAVGNTVFYSGNLYHNPAFDWSPAMSALVIHAGKLDEVSYLAFPSTLEGFPWKAATESQGYQAYSFRLHSSLYSILFPPSFPSFGITTTTLSNQQASLALSMEPITRAYVFPHLTKLLKQTPWAPFPKPPTRYARQVDWWAFLFHCAIILVWDTLFFLPAAIMSVCSHIIAPIVTGSIQKMVVTISFGLSSGDLNHAYIYVDEHLDLDLSSQQVDQWNVQKLLAEAKTKSLKGELMPGYEDDTVEQPEWMEPVSHSPHPHALRSPLRSPRPAAAAAATSVELNQSKDGVHKRKGFRDVVEMRLAGAVESPQKPPRKGFRSVVERRMAGRSGAKEGGDEQDRLSTPPAMEAAAVAQEMEEGGVKEGEAAGVVEASFTAAATAAAVSDAAASSPGLAASSESQQHPSTQKERMVPVLEAPEDSGREKLVYEFLWDDQELAIIAEQSQTFQRLKSQMNKIGRNPRLSEREFERQLQQLCVMIEERMGELTGRFDLNHGAYFRDPRILRVIAHFIEKRELPEWSKDMDGDIWRWNENLAKIQSQQLRQMATGSSSGGVGEGEGKEGGEGSGDGKSRSGRLKSMLKNMRGGSYREGDGSTRARAVNLVDISELAEGATKLAEGATKGATKLAEGLLGSGGFRSKAPSFGVPGIVTMHSAHSGISVKMLLQQQQQQQQQQRAVKSGMESIVTFITSGDGGSSGGTGAAAGRAVAGSAGGGSSTGEGAGGTAYGTPEAGGTVSGGELSEESEDVMGKVERIEEEVKKKGKGLLQS